MVLEVNEMYCVPRTQSIDRDVNNKNNKHNPPNIIVEASKKIEGSREDPNKYSMNAV